MQQTPANLQVPLQKELQCTSVAEREKSIRERTSASAQGLTLETSHWEDKNVKERSRSIM